eukprot:UN20288
MFTVWSDKISKKGERINIITGRGNHYRKSNNEDIRKLLLEKGDKYIPNAKISFQSKI